MSLDTWKDEFYPVEASEAENSIQHSYQKWLGLRSENLEKHNLFVSKEVGSIYDKYGNEFLIDMSTCALCEKYFNYSYFCTNCPLYKSLGHECDSTKFTPFGIWCSHNNPEPMINALKEILGEK